MDDSSDIDGVGKLAWKTSPRIRRTDLGSLLNSTSEKGIIS
jgi:hypothetical protein